MHDANKKVLVTGAGGFIGSHLVERLILDGHDVTAMVRYNSRRDNGWMDRIHGMENTANVVQADIKDADAVRRIMKDMDVVYHLASMIAIPYSYINPREIIETNVIGAINVMAAARENNVGRIIHTSTSEVYGTAKYVPIDENHPLDGQSPYAASKISADAIVMSFHKAYGLPVVIVRPFNTYGPRQSARAVIPTIITQALTRKNIRLGATYPTRDFTYVSDTVNGFIKAAVSRRAVGEVVNLGVGKEVSIGNLVEVIKDIINPDLKIIKDKERIRPQASEVLRLCSENHKALMVMGWKPEVGLIDGLRLTIDWIRDHLDDYKVGYTI